MSRSDVNRYIIYFMMYSVIGWLYEVFLDVVIYDNGFENRGILYGPYCVIYGTGALIFIFCLRKLKDKQIMVGCVDVSAFLVFIGIIVICTVVELIGSYIMEAITGSWMWDYTRFAFNFEGRIALNPSLRFGVGGMVFLYILQPLFEKWVDRLDDRWICYIGEFLGGVLIADAVMTFVW